MSSSLQENKVVQDLIRGNTPSLCYPLVSPTSVDEPLVFLTLDVANIRVLYPTIDTEIVVFQRRNERGPRAAVVQIPCHADEAPEYSEKATEFRGGSLKDNILIEGLAATASVLGWPYDGLHPIAVGRSLRDVYATTMRLLGEKM